VSSTLALGRSQSKKSRMHFAWMGERSCGKTGSGGTSAERQRPLPCSGKFCPSCGRRATPARLETNPGAHQS
jgi:hypothetical protein